MFTNSLGESSRHLQKIQDKHDKWLNRISRGSLLAWMNWVSYTRQLWASIRYGIGVLPATLEDIEGFWRLAIATS